MPYVKSISIRTTVNRSLAYILNPEKTDGLLYTASLNCMTDAKDAYLSMKMVYEHFSGKKYDAPLPLNGKGAVKAIHYVQSFDPEDNISPELAHRIAKAFARKTFGDDCQIVIATHVDCGHIHSHLIVNAYTLSGQKFNDNWTTRNEIRDISDAVCLAFGIQSIPKNQGRSKNIAYNEWEHKKQGTSWKQKIRLEIDKLIGTVKNLDELLLELEREGYSIKRGKYISIKAPGQERFVRTKTLGMDYIEESLISRIKWKDVGAFAPLGELQDSYIKTIAKVTDLARTGKKIQRKADHNTPYSPENDLDLYKLSTQLSILSRDRIGSIGELEGKILKLKNQYEETISELNLLSAKWEQLDSLLGQAELYFALKDKPELTPAEELKLSISRRAALNHSLNSPEDLERLKLLRRETSKKTAVLKETFKDCRQLYSAYDEIADTYSKIAKGDYISRLIAEKRQKKVKI